MSASHVVAFPRPFRHPLPPDARPNDRERFVDIYPHEGRWHVEEHDEGGGSLNCFATKAGALASALQWLDSGDATLTVRNRQEGRSMTDVPPDSYLAPTHNDEPPEYLDPGCRTMRPAPGVREVRMIHRGEPDLGPTLSEATRLAYDAHRLLINATMLLGDVGVEFEDNAVAVIDDVNALADELQIFADAFGYGEIMWRRSA